MTKLGQGVEVRAHYPFYAFRLWRKDSFSYFFEKIFFYWGTTFEFKNNKKCKKKVYIFPRLSENCVKAGECPVPRPPCLCPWLDPLTPPPHPRNDITNTRNILHTVNNYDDYPHWALHKYFSQDAKHTLYKNNICMLPAELIRQPEWIKIANINFFQITLILIFNPDIFAIHILGVKYCYHPRNDHFKLSSARSPWNTVLTLKCIFKNNCKEFKCS